MEFFSKTLGKLLSWIDNGKFFILPMKGIYYLLSVLPFLWLIVLPYLYYQAFDSGMLTYANAWTKIVGVLFMIVFYVFVLAVCIFNFYFWFHRCKKIDHVVKVGDQIVAIPLFSHFVQSLGEMYGLSVAVVTPVLIIILYLFGVLTGVDALGATGGDNYLLIILLGLLFVIIYSVVSIIVGFLIVLITHFLSEIIKLPAQIANDVRDLGDIHRAATMTNEQY